MDRLTGIHAVREALEANRPLDSLLVAKGTHGNRVEELVRLARKMDVPVRFEERTQVDRSGGNARTSGRRCVRGFHSCHEFLRSVEAASGRKRPWITCLAGWCRRSAKPWRCHSHRRLPPARRALLFRNGARRALRKLWRARRLEPWRTCLWLASRIFRALWKK